ncbi:hypothetical protein GEOBRER4_n2776 [Citrifermentans bremense]|uniref:Uncharacterized protein n=1 Tax=Citrifermentans bremense TaxID=60035 RepID=A0A7R7IZB4_9BACT|nr:hypothetical protein GEOBRER4_n2776 [Citrifermentans bremense]
MVRGGTLPGRGAARGLLETEGKLFPFRPPVSFPSSISI